MAQVHAEKTFCILLKDKTGQPVGVVIRNGHWVFHSVEEMSDDAIVDLFDIKDHA